MSHSLNSLRGLYGGLCMGRTTGVSKGVSRSLDYIAHIVVVLRSSYNT